MARSRRRRGRSRSRRSRRGGMASTFGFLRLAKSWKFWALFATVGVAFAAFYSKPLEWIVQGGAKVKEMISKG